MALNEQMNNLSALFAQVNELLETLKKQLSENVGSEKLDGVYVKTSASGLQYAIVSSRLLNGNPWSPSFYIPRCQSEAIEMRLKSANTPDAIKQAITSMVKEKRVKLGSGENIYLNDETISIIKTSELGQWALGEPKPKNAKFELGE